MSPPASHHASNPVLLLGMALFMTGWLAFSLRSGEVYLKGFGVVERSKSPMAFWGACAVKASLALLGAIAFVLSLGHK